MTCFGQQSGSRSVKSHLLVKHFRIACVTTLFLCPGSTLRQVMRWTCMSLSEDTREQNPLMQLWTHKIIHNLKAESYALWNENISCHINKQELSQLSGTSGLQMWMYCAVLSHSVVSDSLRPHGLSPARVLCPWILQARNWSGLPCPPPGDIPNPGIEPRYPALQVDSLPSEPSGKPKCDSAEAATPTVIAKRLGECKKQGEQGNRIGPRYVRCIWKEWIQWAQRLASSCT